MYGEVLALDRTIRSFFVPTHLQVKMEDGIWPWSKDLALAMEQYNIVSNKELSKYQAVCIELTYEYIRTHVDLMTLHRTYFTVALHGQHPLDHPYRYLLLAAYESAMRTYSAVRDLHTVHPQNTNGIMEFWSILFTSCVRISTIVSCACIR